MKKVLIVITKGEIGGAQEVVLQLARGLHAKGHEVLVGYGQGEFLQKELQISGIKTIIFKNLKRTRNPLTNLLFWFEIKRFLGTHVFDVVHIHSSNALFAAWGAKHAKPAPRTIFTFHGMSFLATGHGSKLARLMYVLLFRHLLKWVDVPVTVCNSDNERAISLKLYSKGAVIPIGVTSPAFRLREDARRVLSEKIGSKVEPSQTKVQPSARSDLTDKIIIGSIGRLAYPKNYEFLIDAVSELVRREPKVVCIIIGNGPERKKYERRIRERGIGKHFFLAGESDHAAELLSAFDIFALTSLYEGMPVTLLEAMKGGLPALVPLVGGISEMMQQDRSQTFQSKNMHEFVEKAWWLITNVQQRKALGEENKRNSHRYSVEQMIASYERII